MSVDFAPLRRQTVPEQVATTIRAKILNGELPPGHRLREVELAEKLAVSRGVLREAFRLLAGEQLLVTHPHRGTFVWQPDRREFWELFTLRAGIEGISARLILLGGKREEATIGLENLIDEMAAAEASGESARHVDQRFHDMIVRLAGNRQITRIWESRSPAVWIGGLPAFASGEVPALSDFHRPILSAMARGTPGEAQEAVIAHIFEGLRLTHGLRDDADPGNRDNPGIGAGSATR